LAPDGTALMREQLKRSRRAPGHYPGRSYLAARVQPLVAGQQNAALGDEEGDIRAEELDRQGPSGDPRALVRAGEPAGHVGPDLRPARELLIPHQEASVLREYAGEHIRVIGRPGRLDA